MSATCLMLPVPRHEYPMYLLCFVLLCSVPGTAVASAEGQAVSVALDAAAQALVDRLVFERATVLAAQERRAQEREAQLLDELADKDRDLRRAIADAAGNAKQVSRLQADLAAVSAERQAALDALADRDSQFAADIAAYREQVAAIAGSPDPRKREAWVSDG